MSDMNFSQTYSGNSRRKRFDQGGNNDNSQQYANEGKKVIIC